MITVKHNKDGDLQFYLIEIIVKKTQIVYKTFFN